MFDEMPLPFLRPVPGNSLLAGMLIIEYQYIAGIVFPPPRLRLGAGTAVRLRVLPGVPLSLGEFDQPVGARTHTL